MKNVSSSIKKYVELNDSYHMVLYDNEKKLVFDTVNNFINDITLNKAEMIGV